MLTAKIQTHTMLVSFTAWFDSFIFDDNYNRMCF